MSNDPTKRDVPTAERFYVENPAWTYGKKLVVEARDYDKLAAHTHVLQTQLDQTRERYDEAMRTIERLRGRALGRLMVVK